MSGTYLTAAVLSSMVAYPFDIMKTRRQVNLPNAVFRQGVYAHLGGIATSCMRNSVFVSSKLYAYDTMCVLRPPKSFADRVCYGMLGGVVGATVGTPFDRFMVVTQTMRREENWFEKVSGIYKKDGGMGFWKGYLPNASRAILVTGSQLSVYNQSMVFLEKELDCAHAERVAISSVCAGVITAIISNPIDVCKTRRMTSTLPDTLSGILREEGPKSLFRGLRYSVMRQIPVNLTRFMALEAFR
jgi:dicarboxylate transporter 10